MEDGRLEWQVNLGATMPMKRAVVAMMAVCVGAVGLAFYGSPILAILGPVLLMLAVGELFFPIKFRIDADGATSQCGLSVSRIEWSNVRNVIVDEDGVKLSPLTKNSRMAPFRGVYLRFASNQDIVLAKIRTLWGNDGELMAGGTDRRGSGGTYSETLLTDHTTKTADTSNPVLGDA